MENHPIENLMSTVMTNLKEMIDVNTIVGNPIVVGKNTMIPISKVGFGFAAGGSEFATETLNEYVKNEEDEEISYQLPFGGGSGAGVSIKPIAFLIVDNEKEENNVKIVNLDNETIGDKLVNYIPDAIDKITEVINKMMDKNKCDCDYMEV